MRQDLAEELAIGALGWLAAEPELWGQFLAQSGLDPDGIRAAAGDPGFLGAVLDQILQSDASVLACAAALGRPPQALAEARRALPGGDDPHWT